jgi:hypothetical protein
VLHKKILEMASSEDMYPSNTIEKCFSPGQQLCISRSLYIVPAWFLLSEQGIVE